MRKVLILGLKLFLLAAVAGLALGLTNKVTYEPIQQQAILAAEAARKAVLPAASAFTEATAPEGLLDAYVAYDAAGVVVGKTGTIVTKGYGGEIEITVGVDVSGAVTGISVGGAGFAETAGLGARAKEQWFAEQFIGTASPIAIVKDGGTIDAITAATITSRAVTKAVDAATVALGSLTLPTEG
ncbi:MAG: electron transporter [Clostridiales bacterium]|nr:electron transporter [Clostridiales bacterium]